MDTETLHDSTISIVDGDIGESSTYHDQHEDNSSSGDIVSEFSRAKELLTRMELDIACSTERLVNLNILMMHVAAKASDLEAVLLHDIVKEEILVDSTEEVLEFDFLSEIFDSEVRELGDFMATLQTEILNARQMMYSCKYLGNTLVVILERLDDSEKSLKQSKDEVSDMKTQSTKFRRILSSLRRDENLQEDKGAESLENGSFLHNNAKIKMQTSEQQRHILRMLEKSLATELDLDKKLTESKQMEEELKSRLQFSAREVLSLEEQATDILQRLFEADSAAEVLKGISRELMGRLQLCQFNLNGAAQREAELKSRVESSQALTLKEKTEITALREKVVGMERRVESAEVKCQMLEETNGSLKEELDSMRNNSSPAEMVESLNKELQKADVQLQQAIASVEASEEKQTMLYNVINDMQAVIDDLKSKVLKAEKRADHAEDKWIVLSESNAELNEELSLLKGKLEFLEASVQRAEEAKVATAKDINVRTKIIMDLVMRLAIERERLHKQMSFLVKENKFLGEKLLETKKDRSLETGDHVGKSEGQKEKGIPSISTDELQKPPRHTQKGEPTMPDPTDVESKLKTVRTIDAGRLGFKPLLIAILVVLVAVVALCFLNQQRCPF